MDRVLSLIRRGRIVIGQSYPAVEDIQARMFAIGSYLLVKGSRTFVNLEVGFQPEWFPEYDLDLGRATAPPPPRITALRSRGAYARRYERGLVIVNPADAPVTVALGRTYLLAAPTGGGAVPPSGTPPSTWRLTTRPVSSVTLGPRQAAVLLAR
jgi:hypothetical protein